MLGGRRSGKSSILASIVYALGEGDKASLLSVTDQTDYTDLDGLGIPLKSKRIEIDNYLKKHKNSSKNSLFLVDMSPNLGEGKYHLSTQIQGTSQVDFEFVDVQGESMEVNSRFHESTKNHVREGDVFIVAIDTPYLMQDENENINTVWNRTEEITDMLANISIENEEVDRKLIILCPVKCERWTQNGQAELVTKRVCQAYRKLINNWVSHKAVDIWVMPVETAGGITHAKLLDGYRLFKGERDRTGELCSINDLTGQIMLINGEILFKPADWTLEKEPDKSLYFDYTQIPLSWYSINGKGFTPKFCEQPAYHIFRFLVEKEELAIKYEQKLIDETPWWKRWWKRLWSPPFGKYLKAYRNLIDKMESHRLIKHGGDGFKKIEDIIK